MYCCTYMLAIAGTYELRIYLGSTPIRRAPWSLLVAESAPSPSLSSLEFISPQHPRIGQPCKLLVRVNTPQHAHIRPSADAVQIIARGSQGKAVRLPNKGMDFFAVSVSSNMVCEWQEIQARTHRPSSFCA